MAQRKRIGLVFSYNEKWIAGTYYILNIVHALNTLLDKEKPNLLILSDSKASFDVLADETRYPYLEYAQYPSVGLKYNYLERLLNKLGRTFLKKHLIVKYSHYPTIDMVYPRNIKGLPSTIKKVNWIPDFQEDYLPEFFTENEIKKRKKHQSNDVAKGDIAVFSSKDSLNDFIRLYPTAKAKTFVLPFAVTHPDFSSENIDYLLKKYDLPSAYFFIPNQFWAHKNHIIVLKAVKILINQGVNLTIAMSGKEKDYRNKDNFRRLKNYLEQHSLEKNIQFLGFLPREEQLCIMKNSLAVIQPSLFEGWSTVVEDAKALNKYLIVSDLKVHREQIEVNCAYFNPEDPKSLSVVLADFLRTPPSIETIDYKENVQKFGNDFLNLVKLVSNEG